MNVICPICQDLLEPSNDIFITPCGHVFHFPCLLQWLEKSHTCPQCRQKVRRDSIVRIYFNFSNSESIKDDKVTLQEKLDSLSFQIKLKEKESSNIQNENANLKKQNKGLRDEVRKVESVVREKNSAIYALKAQSEHFKEKCENFDVVNNEKERLQKQIETYESIKTLLSSSNDKVDEILSHTYDVTTLSTYVAILKGELSKSDEKRKELRNTVRRLQSDLQLIKMEKNAMVDDFKKQLDHMEEQLAISCSKNDELQKMLDEQNGEAQASSNHKVERVPKTTTKSVNLKRDLDVSFDIDVPFSVSPPKIFKRQQSRDVLNSSNDSDVVLVSPNIKSKKENAENSPYLSTKSKNILGFKDGCSQRKNSSVAIKMTTLLSSKKFEDARKNSRLQDSTIVLDGFGGHSKLDAFPMPKASSQNKLKRPLNDSTKSKKLKLESSGNKQLDDYIINLS